MIKIKLWIVISAFTLIPDHMMASDGSSGCGPGWYILKDKSLVSSAARAITNGVLFPISTLGMTFGTSNCSKHKIVMKEKESLHYVTMNYFQLKGDVAKGEGAYLEGLAQTIGCHEQSLPVLKTQIKNQYQIIFPAIPPSPEGTLTEIYKVIFQNEELTSQCLKASA